MALVDDAAVTGGSELDWRRPHPVTVLVEIGRAMRQVAIAIVVVSGGLLDRSTFLELALIAAPLIAAIARWFTTRYALDTESIHHHHGLIWRKRQVLPRANVQNVSTTAGLLARLTSVVELQISDASATGEIDIRYVTKDEAERLTALLRSTAPAGSDPGAAVGSGDLPATPTGSPQVGEGTAGLSGPDAPTAAAGPVPGPVGAAVERRPLVAPTIGELARADVISVPTMALVSGAAVVAIAGSVAVAVQPTELPSEVAGFPWLILAGLVFGPLLISTLGIVGRLLTFGGYRLLAEPDRLRIQVGLLTEARVAARRERMQQIRVERDLVHQALGIERVAYETADVEVGGTSATRYLAPVAAAGSWRALAVEVFGELQLEEDDLRPVSELTKRRMFLRFAVGALLGSALALVHVALAVIAVAAILATGRWYSRRRHAVLGWATSDDQYLVRTGVVFGRLTLVELDKIQSLRLSSTIFQRRLDLATIQVSTAGHGFGGLVSLPDLPRPRAERLLAGLATRAARTPIADTL